LVLQNAALGNRERLGQLEGNIISCQKGRPNNPASPRQSRDGNESRCVDRLVWTTTRPSD
jgi:hypothetical protein